MATPKNMGISLKPAPTELTDEQRAEAHGWCAEPEYAYGAGHSGIGWYVWESEYPDEGSFFLGEAALDAARGAGK